MWAFSPISLVYNLRSFQILSTLLPSLYDRGHLLNQMRSSTTSALHSLMMKGSYQNLDFICYRLISVVEILPLIPGILNEKDPIPQYGFFSSPQGPPALTA